MLYVLLRTYMGEKQYAMVFSTYGAAWRSMSDDFFGHVNENDLEVEDGYCFIDEWSAYDSPDASCNEWRIYSAEDRTS